MIDCIIYGAGNWGKKAYQEYKDKANIRFFIDNNQRKQGSKYMGIDILSPDAIADYCMDWIIIAVEKVEGIEQLLYKKGAKKVALYRPHTPLEALLRGDSLQDASEYFRVNCDYRESDIDLLFDNLKKYEVISFDIFDTAIFRKVEFPKDIFRIMGNEMNYGNFASVRMVAESRAREKKAEQEGNREVSIEEIYDYLEDYYGISSDWMHREMSLEKEMAVANPFVLNLCNMLEKNGNEIIFTSDMYLPSELLCEVLKNNGYGTHRVIVSNEYKKCKGDGRLYEELKEQYSGKTIVHIGDNYQADCYCCKEHGIDSIYIPSPRFNYREEGLTSIDASFYRAVINNHMNSVLWKENKHYSHGYRVGGILTLGYCEYINSIAKQKEIDKILFCARDCYVISEVYKKHFNEIDNHYIDISRRAILAVSGEKYFYDYLERGLIRYIDEGCNTKTFMQIFEETGFEYLLEDLEKADIEPFAYPNSVFKYRPRVREFLFSCKNKIYEHNMDSRKAAIDYFKNVISSSRRIMIVDIGWSGTCINALRELLKTVYEDIEVYGSLMCSSLNQGVISEIETENLFSYIYSPISNRDLADFMMPKVVDIRDQDYFHMPLEYMYTSTKPSLMEYCLEDGNNYCFKYNNNSPKNKNEIEEMQRGIEDFARDYLDYSKGYCFSVNPYTAFIPLKEAILNYDYCIDIYKNFGYDAFTAPLDGDVRSFEREFGKHDKEISIDQGTNSNSIGHILFITPELVYTGAPRSLLRMCKVAKKLGYEVTVWSELPGPFSAEYEKNGINVGIVPSKMLENKIEEIKRFDMAICNTIVTDKYVEYLKNKIPVAWFVREATNIPDFCGNNPERMDTLRNSNEIVCVSEYAAAAINKFTNNDVKVIHNCVEDEIEYATEYKVGSGEKVRFVQFGTMEYRKGYDVLISAYQSMPQQYRDKCELYFAGGFIYSGMPFCAWIFPRIENEENIHYLGIVKGEKNKIETLSNMDVVVVASRDESCSLVALEGAMLSKPIIVTENVGAKYIVNSENGYIIKTSDVVALRDAMISMIDNKNRLAEMGEKSREHYDQMANMNNYESELAAFFDNLKKQEPIAFEKELTNDGEPRDNTVTKRDVIVSLTSHPGRIKTISKCIKSLMRQTCMPQKVILWLSKIQFEESETIIPKEIIELNQENNCFEIRWVEEDLKPHKKYFYVMQEYKTVPIILVDDDVEYDSRLVEVLMNSYDKNPDCISCMLTNLMTFRRDGNFRTYKGWLHGYKGMVGVPSFQLMPVGVGGVLYPPNILPEVTYDKEAIISNCLYADDLWLKVMALSKGIKTVLAEGYRAYVEIPLTQEVALSKNNVVSNGNDQALGNILSFYDEKIGNVALLKKQIIQDRFL